MAEPDLIVVIPTRGRPDNIGRVLDAWEFTGAWDVAEMVLAADADDPFLDRYKATIDGWVGDRAPGAVGMMVGPVWVPMVPKLNATATALALSRRPFALGFAGDDHLPRTIGWAQTYVAALRELGTGMVYGDDGYQGAKLSTEWAITSDVVRAIGAMVPAQVDHMYSDVALWELMDEAGGLRHLPQVVIEHMHPIVGKTENDDQYKRVNSREQFRKDRLTYEKWQGTRKPNHVEAVRALRGGRPPERPAAPRKSRATKGVRKVSRNPFPHFFKTIRGATPVEIELTLADLAAQVPADQAIVELGVFQGRTSIIMAWGARQGHGAHVFGFDAWDLPGNTYGPPFTDEGSYRWAKHHVLSLGYQNDVTLTKAFAVEAAGRWGIAREEENRNPDVGLLFVDDDHSAAGCRSAIEAWSVHLNPGAIIAVDDYGHPDWPGVKEAVDALADEGVLDYPQIFHDRLAVTRVLISPEEKTGPIDPVWATPEERYGPLPEIQIDRGGIQFPDPVATQPIEDGWVGDDRPVDRTQAAQSLDLSAITSEGVSPSPEVLDLPVINLVRSDQVAAGELDDVEAGTPVESLNLPQLRALAKQRGIVLGQRKDRKGEVIQALKDGR